MTPDERQLLSGLFDRIRSTGGNQQRDREAESFISDAVRQQPYAPYLLSQTVIVQEQALKAANDRLQELEAKVDSLQRNQGQSQQSPGGNEGFLGGLGRSIFGGGSSQPPAPPAPQPYQPQGQYNQGQQPQYGQPQGGPWGGNAPQAAPPQQSGGGGGFLKGALGMAAGVAGGALLGNAVSGLFHGSNNPFGIASGMGGMGGAGYPGGGETIVNNYYEGDGPGNNDGGGVDNAADYDQGGFDNAADDGDFGGGGDDNSYDV